MMYGLPKETDLTFLVNARLLRVEHTEFQALLHFDRSICVSIEGECELDRQRVDYAKLDELTGAAVLGATAQEDGSINIFFQEGHRLTIKDSNQHYESYQITSPSQYIVV